MKTSKSKIVSYLILALILSSQSILIVKSIDTLITSWGTEHRNGQDLVSTMHPTSWPYSSAAGQTLQIYTPTPVGRVVFYLSVSDPVLSNATYVARIYSAEGTLGSMKPPASLSYLAQSTNSLFSGSGNVPKTPAFVLYTFYFSGLTLQPGNYTVTLTCIEAAQQLATGILIGLSGGDNYVGGNAVNYQSGSWRALPNYDAIFYLYTGDSTSGGDTGPGTGTGFDLLAWIKANLLLVLIVAAIIMVLILWGR